MAASKSQLASEQQMGDTTVAKSIFYIKFVALTHTLVWDQCGSVLVFAPVHPQHEGLSRSTAIAILLKTIKGHIESALQSQLRCFNRPEASVHNTFPGCPLLLKKKKKSHTVSLSVLPLLLLLWSETAWPHSDVFTCLWVRVGMLQQWTSRFSPSAASLSHSLINMCSFALTPR